MIWQGTPLGFDGNGEPIDYHAGDDAGGNAPCLIQGPPGSMKTAGPIISQLLDDDSGLRSYVIFGDGKAEITTVTRTFRSTVSTVKVANYGRVLGIKSDKWNPCIDLDPTAPGFADACEGKAIAVVKPEPNDHNRHFTDGARSAATLAFMRIARRARAENRIADISEVREFLMRDPAELRAEIENIMQFGEYDEHTRAAKFLNDNTEIQNLKSTIEVATSWMTREIREDMAGTGGIDFRDCKKRPMTIYFIVPTTEMQAKASYTRLGLSSCLRALYTHDGFPTTVIIEEAFVLGYHEEIEQALSILRGYNSRMTVVFQSYQQIKKLYPQTHGLFTAGAVLAFRPGSLEDAKWLVERVGKHVVPILSAADPTGPRTFGARPSWQQQLRDRIPLAKMLGMPRGRALVWKPGDEVPRISWVNGYFEIPALNQRATPNPYVRPRADPSEPSPPHRGGTSTLAVIAALLVIGFLFLVH
jgi:type IV secretory pathway TraG/TraD family ATPase VirD4